MDKISKVNLKIEVIEQPMNKPFDQWTEKEKVDFGNTDSLQLRELAIPKRRQHLQGSAMDVGIPRFDPAAYKARNLLLFPFFNAEIEKYFNFSGENAFLGRDHLIQEVNTIMARGVEKYQPFICTTSRGMGKTAFMMAIGMQVVKPHLKSQRIMDALAYGRMLSFDFACGEQALRKEEDIETFFTRLMIYFLCRMFDGTAVDGIWFQEIGRFSDIPTFQGKQSRFQQWLETSLQLNADAMMDEYIRLTNIAFGVMCSSPPVFMLDEIQQLCKGTTIESKREGNQVIYHSFLSFLLTQLAGKHRPLCICSGTNNGNIIHVTEKSRISPQFVSLTALHREADCKLFWQQRTEYLNVPANRPWLNIRPDFTAHSTDEDEDMINELVYAAYQIPRLLVAAHRNWFKHKSDFDLIDPISVLQLYEDEAISYYSEITELSYNREFKNNDIPHILMCCGVHWQVRDINDCVPGTDIPWTELIRKSLVFPYTENCYIIPFQLMWADKTPRGFRRGHYEIKKARARIQKKCSDLVPGLNIFNLFVSYHKIQQMPLLNLGHCYESVFASSLLVKYYLRRLECMDQEFLPMLDVYDVEHEDATSMSSLANMMVNFSLGIHEPQEEAFLTSTNLPAALIHNIRTETAHHDLIIPAQVNGIHMYIPVSCKASFDLSRKNVIETQLKTSKEDDTSVPRLIWVYLGNVDREARFPETVTFLNGSGCCNRLTLDMFVLMKRLKF